MIATLNITLRGWHIVNIVELAQYRLLGHRLRSATRSPVFVKTAIMHKGKIYGVFKWFLSICIRFSVFSACRSVGYYDNISY